MKKKITFTLYLLWLTIVTAYAQFSVTAAIDSTSMLLGDQTSLRFNISLPQGATYEAPDFKAQFDTLSFVEIIDIQAPTTAADGSTQQVLTITSFEDGTHQIPSVSFSTQVENKKYNAISNPMYLEVRPIVIDSLANSETRFQKDIIEEPMKISDWIHWVYIPLIALALLTGLYFLWKRSAKRKNSVEIQEETPQEILPAHVLAFRQLEDLKTQQLWQQGKIKAYYSRISLIAREYLENRYQFNALESVTDEIVPELPQHNIETALQEDISQTLRLADMVKFAKVIPSEEQHHSVFKKLYNFVEQTQFIPPIEPEANEEV